MIAHCTKLFGAALFAVAICVAGAQSVLAKDVVDASNTRPAKEVKSFLKNHVAQGNERDAGIDVLKFNKKTGNVKGTVWVLCRHKVSKNPFNGKPIYAYSYKLTCSFEYNVITRKGDSTLDFGKGIKVKMSQVAKILAALV